METDSIILLYLTVPAILFIAILIAIELKIFRMAVVIVLAAMAALFEKLDRKYEKAIEEIEKAL
jgi:hypothetical protein